MTNGWLRRTDQGVLLSIRVIPRASQNAIEGILGDTLKIRLTAPPVDDKANTALIAFLAERLDIPRSSIVLVTGRSGRNKRLLVQNLPAPTICRKLSGGTDT